MKNLPIATFINAVAIVVGCLLGLLLKDSFPDGVRDILFQAIGLGTILIGINMALELPDGYMLVFIFSLVFGGICGELLHIDHLLNQLSEWMKSSIGSSDSTFTEGFVTAFMLYCIGSMAFIGALEEGISGKRDLLLVKSMLDGFSSIALAATFGMGVAFSIVPLLILQGGITLSANRLEKLFTHKVVQSISAVGGVLILGISINILQLGKINLENLLPSIFFVILFARVYQRVKNN